MINAHDMKKTYKCELCETEFTAKSSLIDHEKYVFGLFSFLFVFQLEQCGTTIAGHPTAGTCNNKALGRRQEQIW